jgi:hypothetical protein
VDNAGEPVWIRPASQATTNLRVQRYRGQPVLTWWQGDIASYGVGTEGEYLVLNSSYQPVTTVKAQDGLAADLHEFVISGEGIAYFTAYRQYSTDLSAIGGPTNGTALDATIQGVDLGTGALVFDWHSADHIELTESHVTYSSMVPFDPVHVNSIDFATDGKLLVSARNTWTVYKIDPATGDIVWRLGGKRSNFSFGPGVGFAWQHDARVKPDNLLTLFDDEAAPPEAKQSRGLVLDVDESAMTATLVRQYTHPSKPLLAASQGSIQALPNGDVLLGWGAEPYYTEYREDGSMVLDGRFETGQSYRAFRFPWTATPTESPALAVERTGASLVVYASWNGSTETARWMALGGAAPNALAPLGAARRTGFETTINVSGKAAYVAARALDIRGRALGTSAPIKV